MADHDGGYKLLFSHPRMVEDLVRGFVREPWVKKLDFGSLERVAAGGVSDRLRRRDGDLLWRLRWQNGEWLYVYLLIEFQSSVDPFMAVRILTYVALLYQDLIRRKQLTEQGKLPPVLPLVLYNGGRRWTAARDISDLVEAVPGALGRYRPQLKYLLLDERRLAETEDEGQRNAASALFSLEAGCRGEEVGRVLATLNDWLGRPEDAELRRAFSIWLRHVLLPRRAPGVKIPQVEDLEELTIMLRDQEIDWSREWKLKGWREGRREGRREGEAEVLLHLLGRKFGPLDATIREQIQAANSRTLRRWAEKLLSAKTLAETLGRTRRRPVANAER